MIRSLAVACVLAMAPQSPPAPALDLPTGAAVSWRDTLAAPSSLKELAETAANVAQALALLAGAFIYWRWRKERGDRTADMLLKMDEQFMREGPIREAREMLDLNYSAVRDDLKRSIEQPRPVCSENLKQVDAFLRFYLVLRALIESRQIQLQPARVCFRYYLCLYFRKGRPELKEYVDEFYPTLSQWLNKKWFRRFVTRGDVRTFSKAWDRLDSADPTTVATPRAAMSATTASNGTWSPEVVAAATKRVLVVTGAGISAESGIPTYRGSGGIWREVDFEQMATLEAFQSDRDRIWRWYEDRRSVVRSARPNPAHVVVADLAMQASELLVVTQNVDDLHERAGLPPENLVHVHGRILESTCARCGHAWPAGPDDVQGACGHCGAVALRPAVVWFDEELPRDVVQRVEEFLKPGPCDLVLVVGTTASFEYIGDWVGRAAGDTGIVVDVNPEDSALAQRSRRPITHVRAPAAAALAELARLIARRRREQDDDSEAEPA